MAEVRAASSKWNHSALGHESALEGKQEALKELLVEITRPWMILAVTQLEPHRSDPGKADAVD